MPIYEYQCQHCHHCFEIMQKMSDSPETLCPNCNQNEAKRLVSAAGFQLKGTGWYVTDFKDKGKPKAATEKATVATDTATTTTTTGTGDKGDK